MSSNSSHSGIRLRRGVFRGSQQSGYVLLTLLLMVALMGIAFFAVLPAIKFEAKRDLEEELIHRGVQYSRAIRSYYKKFGRYPTRLEELESSNNQRFLRKRYKDPITGQDFKLLHFGEVKMTFSGGIGGAQGINGAGPLNSPGGQSSPFGSQPGTFGQQPGGLPVAGTFPTSNSNFGSTAQNPPTGTPNPSPDQNQDSNAGPKPASGEATPQSGSSSGDQLSGQTFGGGPIVGVMSSSKKDSIREFNHKKKYNEWQFIYDPATDRGGLLSTPNQPPLQGIGGQPGQPGQPNSGTTVNGPIPGMQNNPGYPSEPGGPGTPTTPPNQEQK